MQSPRRVLGEVSFECVTTCTDVEYLDLLKARHMPGSMHSPRHTCTTNRCRWLDLECVIALEHAR